MTEVTDSEDTQKLCLTGIALFKTVVLKPPGVLDGVSGGHQQKGYQLCFSIIYSMSNTMT